MARKPNGRKRSVQSDTFERLEKYWDKEVGVWMNKWTDGLNPQTFERIKVFNCRCSGVCRGYCIGEKYE